MTLLLSSYDKIYMRDTKTPNVNYFSMIRADNLDVCKETTLSLGSDGLQLNGLLLKTLLTAFDETNKKLFEDIEVIIRNGNENKFYNDLMNKIKK